MNTGGVVNCADSATTTALPGRTFMVYHQFVTLAVEVKPDVSQGHLGRLLFAQIDGDSSYYCILRDELKRCILI